MDTMKKKEGAQYLQPVIINNMGCTYATHKLCTACSNGLRWSTMNIYMAIYGHIWPYMTIYGPIWPYMDTHGHIVIYGHMTVEKYRCTKICDFRQPMVKRGYGLF